MDEPKYRALSLSEILLKATRETRLVEVRALQNPLMPRASWEAFQKALSRDLAAAIFAEMCSESGTAFDVTVEKTEGDEVRATVSFAALPAWRWRNLCRDVERCLAENAQLRQERDEAIARAARPSEREG